MKTALIGFKGFPLRRRGRPVGSRCIDRDQFDLFPVEKLFSQCGLHKQLLYVPVTRKVSPENGTEKKNAVCKVVLKIEQKGGND